MIIWHCMHNNQWKLFFVHAPVSEKAAIRNKPQTLRNIDNAFLFTLCLKLDRLTKLLKLVKCCLQNKFWKHKQIEYPRWVVFTLLNVKNDTQNFLRRVMCILLYINIPVHAVLKQVLLSYDSLLLQSIV